MNATTMNRSVGVRAIIAVATAIALVISMGLPAVMGDRAYASQSSVRLSLSSPASVSINQGGKHSISAKASKGAKLKYKSSKKSVATVSKKGVVKAKRPGKATITVTAKKGKKSVKKKVKVKVVSLKQRDEVADQPNLDGGANQAESDADTGSANSGAAEPAGPGDGAQHDGLSPVDPDPVIIVGPGKEGDSTPDPSTAPDTDNDGNENDGGKSSESEKDEGQANDADLDSSKTSDQENDSDTDADDDDDADAEKAPEPKTYTVKFDANGGTGDMQSQDIAADRSALLNANTFTREGYRFFCWTTEADGSGERYGDKTRVSHLASAGESVTLYAQWVKKDPGIYSIHYLPNGGKECVLMQISIPRDSSFPLVANRFTRDGYTFTGWNTEADGSGVAYEDEQVVCNLAPKGGSVGLYAQWVENAEPEPEPEPVPTTYLVSFDANGGTGSMTMQELKSGISTALIGNAYYRSGYTFANWNTKPDGTGVSYANRASVRDLAAAGGKATLYAQWNKNAPTTYTVSFSANGGSGSMASQTMTVNTWTSLKTNTLTRSGYTFAGWNTAANGTGASYANGASVYNLTSAGGSITLYAQWKYIKRGVVVEGGKTHYYDQNGNQVFGWIHESTGYHYCNPSTGDMAKGGEVWTQAGTGSLASSGYRYFDSNGLLQFGWQTVNAKTKYFKPSSGLRATGRLYIVKGECGSAVSGYRYFDDDGYIVLGWKRFSDGDRYFELNDGVMVTGAYNVPYPGGSDPYYFSSDGIRLADVAHGDYYYRASDGAGIRFDSNEFARLVFEEYNRFRLTRSNAAGGHYTVAWSGDANYGSSCGDAREARVSCNACAAAGKLVHTAYDRRADLRASGVYMCDILMRSTTTLTPSAIINSWAESTGHRKMMQCDTAHHAGFAAVHSGSYYYFTIVYEWSGASNQSGS